MLTYPELKYMNTQVVFQEFPGETTLAINISGCPNHCPGCHSPYLWEDKGTPLTVQSVSDLIKPYGSVITCVGFMGGDQNIRELHKLVDKLRSMYPHLRFGWYSGKNKWSEHMMEPFDYVKFGSYKKECGGLDSPTTNQVLLKRIANKDRSFDMWLNITKYFWKTTPRELKDVYLKTTWGNIMSMYHISSKTAIFQGVGLTTDGYETKMVPPTVEDFAKGFIMALSGETPPSECVAHKFRRKSGSNDEWEDMGPITSFPVMPELKKIN